MQQEELTQVAPIEAARASRLLLTVPEAATVLGISRSKLYELMTRRVVQSVRIDKMRRVPVEALEAYVADLLAEEDSPYAASS